MNPEGLAQAVRYLGKRQRRPRQSLVMTTSECTSASVVNDTTIAFMQAVGATYLASSPSPGAVYYYNVTMDFLVNISLGLGQVEGVTMSLWDAVTALILLGAHPPPLGCWGVPAPAAFAKPAPRPAWRPPAPRHAPAPRPPTRRAHQPGPQIQPTPHCDLDGQHRVWQQPCGGAHMPGRGPSLRSHERNALLPTVDHHDFPASGQSFVEWVHAMWID